MTQKFHFAILRIDVIRASRGLFAIAELLVIIATKLKERSMSQAVTNAKKSAKCSPTRHGISYQFPVQQYSITDRTSSVHTARRCSFHVIHGVPSWKNFSSPLLFMNYISPIAGIAYLRKINQQRYSDDIQLFISLSPSNYMRNLSNITNCIDGLHVWFCINGMTYNLTNPKPSYYWHPTMGPWLFQPCHRQRRWL